MMTGAFSWNVGKLFSELKLVTNNLSLYLNSTIFLCPEAGEHCPVCILDMCFCKLPKESISKDILFFQPLEETPNDPTSPWYSNQPVDKHTLEMKLSKMWSLAGQSISNHNVYHCKYFLTFSYQQTPLHVAASRGRDYTVECLVRKGADKNMKDKNGVNVKLYLWL